ncbi:transmembrane protein 107 isoform X3 [Chrysemys picta bellii]|uniref:transmembrane protein 107 isoform X3 n=1 Tax=Chrysemys picta bellii TaxID=8478 RepID=UPI0032B21395
MALVSGLVPARFLTLTAHLVIVITIFWSRDNNVLASLPLQYSQQQYQRQDVDHRGPHCRRRGPPLLPLRPVGQQPLLVDLCLLQHWLLTAAPPSVSPSSSWSAGRAPPTGTSWPSAAPCLLPSRSCSSCPSSGSRGSPCEPEPGPPGGLYHWLHGL